VWLLRLRAIDTQKAHAQAAADIVDDVDGVAIHDPQHQGVVSTGSARAAGGETSSDDAAARMPITLDARPRAGRVLGLG
jgi:hypothetical protein